MILLEMYLDGQLIDTIQPSIIFLQKSNAAHLAELTKELKKKHALVLSAAHLPPVFILSGVPSSINFFKSLQHNKNCSG